MDEQSDTSVALPKPKKVYEKFHCVACGGRYTIANKGKHMKTKKHTKAIGSAPTTADAEHSSQSSDQE